LFSAGTLDSLKCTASRLKNVLRVDFELSPFPVFQLQPDLGVEVFLVVADAVVRDASNGPV
jgi:hypothetical protein